jgi:predicted secreted protein
MGLVKAAAASFWSTVAVIVMISAVAITVAVRAFGLTVAGGIALYFVTWWVVLFAILPFGVRSQAETDDVVAGTDPGAPAVPALREKSVWTTLWASLVLLLVSGFLPLAGL